VPAGDLVTGGENGSSRLEHAERLLDERGRRIGPVRVAAGRSGVAVAFPRDPMLHVSWAAFAAIGGLTVALRLLRSRSR
jgi:hypothetical protein